MRLCEQSHVALVDCQLPNDHLLSLGAVTLPRADFLVQLDTLISDGSVKWQSDSHKPLAVSLLDTIKPWQLKLR